MGSSPGFGSPRRDLPPTIPKDSRRSRPVRTRFRCASAPDGAEADHDAELAGSFFNRHAIRSARASSDCLSAHGFRISFTPRLACFSPFPHGTRPLSVAAGIEPWEVVSPASHRIPRVRWYSRAAPPGLASSTTGLSPSLVGLSRTVRLTRCLQCGESAASPCAVFQPPLHIGRLATQWSGFGLFPFRSPLLRE